MARSIETYRKMLPVMKHRLDDELEIYSQMYDDIAREVVVRNSRSMSAKDELARLEARLSEEFKSDDPKLSNPNVESKVRRDPDRIKLWERFMDARADHEEWSGLLDAWRQKGYSIKTMADLFAAQYFAISSHQAHQRSERNHSPPETGMRRATDQGQDEARGEYRRSKIGHTPALSADDSKAGRSRRGLL